MESRLECIQIYDELSERSEGNNTTKDHFRTLFSVVKEKGFYWGCVYDSGVAMNRIAERSWKRKFFKGGLSPWDGVVAIGALLTVGTVGLCKSLYEEVKYYRENGKIYPNLNPYF